MEFFYICKIEIAILFLMLLFMYDRLISLLIYNWNRIRLIIILTWIILTTYIKSSYNPKSYFVSYCYELRSLGLDDKTTLVLSNTRELDRELFYKLVYLIYIVLQMVYAKHCAPYPKQPCVVHEVNMWCPCYMMLFVLKSSTKFSWVLWSVLWLCYQVTVVTAWPINPNPSYSKNRKIGK